MVDSNLIALTDAQRKAILKLLAEEQANNPHTTPSTQDVER
jgi:hypothetical protein